jgi:phosphatidylserine/phosphatidylglycerophosphate/cardiolipin synthase-like enzyme
VNARWSRLFPEATKNNVEFFLDGRAYFSSLVEAIEAAGADDHYVYVLGWMLDIDFPLIPGQSDKTLFKLLEAATKRNTEIRILIWDSLLSDYAATLSAALPRLNKLSHSAAFADSYTFFPPTQLDFLHKKVVPAVKQMYSNISGITRLGDPYIFQLYAMLARNPGAHHEKVVVVKNARGLMAYCGGMDINPNRLQSDIGNQTLPYPTVHDLTCRVEGPAAHEVLQRFRRRWTNHPDAHGTALRGASEPKPKPKADAAPYATVVGTYNQPDGHGTPDRSGRQAYLKIIENALSYIYIEDQYLVNLDVARALNAKLKERNFQMMMFAIQDSKATDDLLIPYRKRGTFFQAVLDGTSKLERQKVHLTVIDRSRSVQDRYHPGMHAKTLIVDDQVAVIGSMNVNQRSFTNDSETSIVVFNDGVKVDGNFARSLRIQTWKEYLRKPAPADIYESPYGYPLLIDDKNNISILIEYDHETVDDLDVRISGYIKAGGVASVMALSALTGGDLTAMTVALSPVDVALIFDLLWDNAIDPKVD